MGLTSSHLKSCWIWWFATVSQCHQVVCTRLNTLSCFTASRPHASYVRVIFSLIFPPWHKLLPLNNQGGLAAHNYLSKHSWSARCQHDYFTAPLSRPEPPQSRVVKARLVWYLPIQVFLLPPIEGQLGRERPGGNSGRLQRTFGSKPVEFAAFGLASIAALAAKKMLSRLSSNHFARGCIMEMRPLNGQ